jgi:hypothetical protein
MSDRSAAREIDLIERAFDVLLTAIEQHRDTQQMVAARACPIKIISAAELCALSPVEAMLADPIARNLRLGVRLLGGRLNGLGGFNMMQAVAERVAAKRPECEGSRLAVLDHAFDGVGHWVA